MGNYVNTNLINGESVEYETKLHWKIFITLKALITLFISPIIQLKYSEFAITNKRIIIKTGFLSRNTLEMNLSKIETVNVNQSIWGRIFGFGTIIIIGTGSTKEAFSGIRKPLVFRKKFQELS